MKNIQVIDGANNCSYDIFSISDDDFIILFPADGQDIEFIEDVAERNTVEKIENMRLWDHPVKKTEVIGIHGTLFYELHWKKKYYPTKKSSEMATSVNFSNSETNGGLGPQAPACAGRSPAT